jgi:hypothetical protein
MAELINPGDGPSDGVVVGDSATVGDVVATCPVQAAIARHVAAAMLRPKERCIVGLLSGEDGRCLPRVGPHRVQIG